jgi:repressor LexA
VDVFERYTREHGISPTLEEIATALGVNKVTVFGHVAELERKGVLVRAARGVSRGLQIRADSQHPARVARLSILGSIAAGTPIETLENPEPLDLSDLTPAGADCYALRVRGDSMIDDGIRDGDVVLVERRTHAHNGEIVVAVLPDETATLKRLYREGGQYRLQPANPALQARIVDSVEVRGVVLGLLRRF